MVNDDGFTMPDLVRAGGCCGLEIGELVEPVLSAMDAGYPERKAITMSIIELLQRRGAYRGEVRRMVESGLIFQMDAAGRRVPVQTGGDDVADTVDLKPVHVEEVVA